VETKGYGSRAVQGLAEWVSLVDGIEGQVDVQVMGPQVFLEKTTITKTRPLDVF